MHITVFQFWRAAFSAVTIFKALTLELFTVYLVTYLELSTICLIQKTEKKTKKKKHTKKNKKKKKNKKNKKQTSWNIAKQSPLLIHENSLEISVISR